MLVKKKWYLIFIVCFSSCFSKLFASEKLNLDSSLTQVLRSFSDNESSEASNQELLKSFLIIQIIQLAEENKYEINAAGISQQLTLYLAHFPEKTVKEFLAYYKTIEMVKLLSLAMPSPSQSPFIGD